LQGAAGLTPAILTHCFYVLFLAQAVLAQAIRTLKHDNPAPGGGRDANSQGW
jgi:hypothetical protein